jgi:hypothetical protein
VTTRSRRMTVRLGGTDHGRYGRAGVCYEDDDVTDGEVVKMR